MNAKIAIFAALLALAGCDAGTTGSASGISPATTSPPITAAQAPVDPHPLYTDKVAFIGDSITWIWNQPERLQQQNLLSIHLHEFIDAGISGNETSEMLARFDVDVMAQHPDVVVILGGVNDLKNSGIDPATIASNIFAMVQKAESAGAKVIVGTVLSIGIAYAPQDVLDLNNPQIDALNKLIVAGASQYGYTVADYHPAMLATDGTADGSLLIDGLHPNDAGYAAMWKALKPLLPVDARAN